VIKDKIKPEEATDLSYLDAALKDLGTVDE
jgi:hypothetical protein